MLWLVIFFSLRVKIIYIKDNDPHPTTTRPPTQNKCKNESWKSDDLLMKWETVCHLSVIV